ncbi:MAG TPA: hypothetical protein P5181_05185 [Dermatophilaceae bacterium]|nr:hypothetical protein [Dermatophilaceae bacterium]
MRGRPRLRPGEATDALRERFAEAWPQALALWGPALRLHDPDLHPAGRGEPTLAWFSLGDASVSVDLAEVSRLGLDDLAVPILAHEIGHHVLAPATRTDNALVLARVRAGLGDRPRHGAMVANLWCDTLVNDRLRRRHELPMEQVYLRSAAAGGRRPTPPWWWLWMRTFELLWALPTATLTGGDPAPFDGRHGPPIDDSTRRRLEADAWLLSRHTRAFATDPVGGAAGFAAVLRPWLPEQAIGGHGPACGGDTDDVGGEPLGGLAGDPRLGAPVVPPALDPRVNPEAGRGLAADDEPPAETPLPGPSGQGYGPAELAGLYAALGSTRDAAVDYYRAQARRHQVPFPVQPAQRHTEPELTGWDGWNVGDPLTDLDWQHTVLRSPVVVPGVTTLRRLDEPAPTPPGRDRPVDLDLYVDCSGSMPNPRTTASPATIAAAVLALSALRVGGQVQVTVWSGPGQVARTAGFVRDEDEVLTALVTHFGGGTSFPLPLLAADHPPGRAERTSRRVHICCLSDSGVESMFGVGQRDSDSGVAHAALESAGGGGSLILVVPAVWASHVQDYCGNYVVYPVPELTDVVPFARAFAARTWGVGVTRSAKESR